MKSFKYNKEHNYNWSELLMTVSQDVRWKAEVEIIQEEGEIPSSRKMQQLLKERFGITANHATINADLKQDLEALTKEEYANQKGGILQMLNTELDIAHNIVTTETDNEIKLKAMNTVTKLSKTKSEVLIKFRKAQTQLAVSEKPVIEVFIGKPVEIDMKKFNKRNKDDPNDKKET